MLVAGLVLSGFASAAMSQLSPSIRIREGANGVLGDASPTVTSRLYNCISLGFWEAGSVAIRYAPDSNWDIDIRFDFTDSPQEIARTICGMFPVCPVPVIDQCGPEIIERIAYHTLRGGISSYVAAAGGGFSGGASYRRIVTATLVVDDVLEIDSPIDTVLELPVLASGNVFGAESFGNPDETWARARLEIVGIAAGESIDLRCQVESDSVFPTENAINVVRRVPLAVSAGRNFFPISLAAAAEVDLKATSAGLFGTITGSSTGGASFGNSLRLLRVTGTNDSPLPPGIVIRGGRNGVVYEDTRLRCVADYNRDGGVDGADVESFFLDWQVGGQAADLNLDGGVDGGDIETFFTRWETGC
jgi:hypothetical protein